MFNASLLWVKSKQVFLKIQAGTGDNLLEERRARHGMPGQRHGPVQGKLHPRRGAGIELPASLRQGLRQGRLLRHPERNVVESKDPVGGRIPLARTPLLTTPSAGGQHLGACSLVRMATKVGPQTPAPQRPAHPGCCSSSIRFSSDFFSTSSSVNSSLLKKNVFVPRSFSEAPKW